MIGRSPIGRCRIFAPFRRVPSFRARAISIESDGESCDTADDGTGWLSSLLPLRADMTGGDERSLYLAWLDVQCGDIDDDAIEPKPPDGLGTLTPPLESYADIIGLDRDLVAVAAQEAPQVSP